MSFGLLYERTKDTSLIMIVSQVERAYFYQIGRYPINILLLAEIYLTYRTEMYNVAIFERPKEADSERENLYLLSIAVSLVSHNNCKLSIRTNKM